MGIKEGWSSDMIWCEWKGYRRSVASCEKIQLEKPEKCIRCRCKLFKKMAFSLRKKKTIKIVRKQFDYDGVPELTLNDIKFKCPSCNGTRWIKASDVHLVSLCKVCQKNKKRKKDKNNG